jgi:outer membrane protein TolC
LQAEDALSTAKTSLATSDLMLQAAEVRSASGMMSPVDYLQAQSNRESRAVSVLGAEQELTLSRVRLFKLLKIKAPAAAFELAPVEYADWEALLKKIANFGAGDISALTERLRKAVLAENPSYAKSVLTNRRSELSLSSAKAAYFPTVSAGVDLGLNYGYSRGALDGSITSAVSISATIPLDYWVISNNIEKQKLSALSSGIDFENANEDLEIEIQSTVLKLISQAASTLSARRADEYAERHFEQVAELFSQGRSSVSDFSDAAASRSTSANSLSRSLYGFLSAMSSIRTLAALDDTSKLLALILGD